MDAKITCTGAWVCIERNSQVDWFKISDILRIVTRTKVSWLPGWPGTVWAYIYLRGQADNGYWPLELHTESEFVEFQRVVMGMTPKVEVVDVPGSV